MTVRILSRQLAGGTGFGNRGMGYNAVGGSWVQPGAWRDPRDDTSAPHPYFDWLKSHPDQVYGQDSYNKWVGTLPASTPIIPTPPPQGVYPNDPSKGGGAGVTPGGGAGAAPAPAAAAAKPAAAPAGVNTSSGDISGYLLNGGQITGQSADGKTVIMTFNGQTLYFDGRTGAQVAGAGAAPSAGAPGQPAAAAAARPGAPAGAGAAAAGTTSRVGTKITGKDANGRTVSGTITADANGQTTVKWDDGTTASYDSKDGHLLSSQGTPTGTTTTATGTTPAAPPVQGFQGAAPQTPSGGSQSGLTPGDVSAPVAPPPAVGAVPVDAGLGAPPPTTATFDPGVAAGGVGVAPATGFSFAGPNTLDPGATTGPDVTTAMSTLASMPPPDSSYTIPTQYSVQLPPPVDETMLSAGMSALI